jgi:hypothetical protein
MLRTTGLLLLALARPSTAWWADDVKHDPHAQPPCA